MCRGAAFDAPLHVLGQRVVGLGHVVSEMEKALISIVVPCHNHGIYLSDAIESVLKQEGFGNSIEVIVINDHSDDPDTLQKLSYWQAADPLVRVLDNPGRVGAATARNLGIAAASAEWIAFLDADDVWVPGGLAARWRVIQGSEEVEWLGADFNRWYEDGRCDAEGFFKTRSSTHDLLRASFESGKVMRLTKPVREFLQVSFGWTSTIIARKSLLLKAGGFEPKLGNYEDHHLWIRLARLADFYFVPEVVTLYRQHANTVSRRDGPTSFWYILAARMLRRDPGFRQYRPFIRRKLASLFEQDMYYHRRQGETRLAVVAAAQALFHRPACMKSWKNLLAAAIGRR